MELPQFIPADEIECLEMEYEDETIGFALMYEEGIICTCASHTVALTILAAVHAAGGLNRKELN